VDYFSALVYDINPDIIGVTESWTNADITDAEILLPGYIMFRCDRPTGNKGGGVLLYVRSSLNPVTFTPKSKYPEHIWCKLNVAKNTELLVGVCYRSTNPELFDYDVHTACVIYYQRSAVITSYLWGILIIPVLTGLHTKHILEVQWRPNSF